ncbi:MAG: hypothetical protein WC516_09270 [Patescibacteria group bacterium]
MTQEQIDCFKREVREEICTEVNSNFSWMKWVLGLILTLLLGFEANNIYNSREIAVIKQEYMTKALFQEENDKLKLEITKKFSLPVQLVMAQMKQIQAKLIDKNQRDFEKAKDDEYRITQEMIRLNYDMTTRGGK